MTAPYATQNALLYRGFELHVEEPAWSADTDASIDRRVTHLGSRIGWEREMVRTTSERSTLVFGWHMDQRNEIDRFVDFVYRRRGMMEPVWMPSWKDDLVLAADVAAVDTAITVVACGYTSRMFPHEHRRHLIFLDPASNYTIRRVTASVDNGDGTETLTLESAIKMTQVKRGVKVCFLLLMRQSADVVEIISRGIDFMLSSIAFTEIPEELLLAPFTATAHVTVDPAPTVDVAWLSGYPIGVGGDSVDFRWTAPPNTVEIAIETSATIGGTYTPLFTFSDGAHVPNGAKTDTGSYPNGTVRYARVRAYLAGSYYYSTEVSVTWGNTSEVAPVLTALYHVLVGVSVYNTHVAWTVASGAAMAVKIYAQTVIFAGIVPNLVHTITNPSDIISGSYEIPGSMAAVQLKAVYVDAVVAGPLVTV